MQLISGEGDFKDVGLDEFIQTTELSKCGSTYAVVAILGPQSSGKSTLLNHMFHTNFREMDASQGRNQTTQGIWMEKCAGAEPFTVVMDVEGTDGSERGENDTAFEKQSALFALAVADIVIINMWCHDVGREHAANKPLLRTVFQVMMNIFGARRTTLLFVLRDKTRTPLHYLESTLRKNAEEIWDSIQKPASLIDTPLSEFFNVDVVALPSYEQNEDLFKDEVTELRQRMLNSIAGNRQDIPASGFSVSVQHIWKSIKENKDLDLPSHKVMIATIRCGEIVNEKFDQLSSNKDWLALERAIQSGQPAAISTFGSKLSSILETCFAEYDQEALHFDEGVRNEKRKLLESKAFDLVHPTQLHFRAFEELNRAVAKPVESLFENPNNDTWAEIRKLFRTQTEIATSKMLGRVSHLELPEETIYEMTRGLRDYARNVVKTKATETDEQVLQRMKIRFAATLDDAFERKKGVKRSSKHARAESLKLLSVMAAMRLDELPDKIEKILLSSLLKKNASPETLASTTWLEVSPKDTLIAPARCSSLWEKFQPEIRIQTQDFIQRKTQRESLNLSRAQTALAVAGAVVAVAGRVAVAISLS